MHQYFDGFTGLTAILVDTNNKFYSSRDGVLFNKKGDTLIKYPAKKKEKHYAIPKDVTWIGFNAFKNNVGLTSVSIPTGGITHIGGAFSDCANLTAILVDTNNKFYSSRDGILFNKKGNTLVSYPAGKKGTYAIPAGVTSIGNYAFDGCTGLISVSIPASVKSIGRSAFSGCTGLTSIDIPAGVKSMSYAFVDCTGLTSVSIPASVKSIGDAAFIRCTGLTSIDIPASVTSIGDAAFSRLHRTYRDKHTRKR